MRKKKEYIEILTDSMISKIEKKKKKKKEEVNMVTPRFVDGLSSWP